MVFNHVISIVKNFHDSEEVTNDVFLKMIRQEANPKTAFNPDLSALSTWIRTITKSVVLDYFRTNHQDHYVPVSNLVSDGQKENEESKVYYQFVAPKTDRADEIVLTSEIKGKINNAIDKLDVIVGLQFFISFGNMSIAKLQIFLTCLWEPLKEC